MLKIKITSRDGTEKYFSRPCGITDGDVNLRTLHESCVNMQNEVNAELTKFVDKEKSEGLISSNYDEDDNDEESEDEDGEPSGNEPAEKRLKT